MTFDPETATLVAVMMAVTWTMTFSGLRKHMLELKRRRRVCPSCGRHIHGAVCREH